jgi:hypothetical protein
LSPFGKANGGSVDKEVAVSVVSRSPMSNKDASRGGALKCKCIKMKHRNEYKDIQLKFK